MTLRANKLILAGTVVRVAGGGKIARVDLDVPQRDGAAGDDGVAKTATLAIMFRDNGENGMVDLALSMKTGDFMCAECEYFQQPVAVDGKDKPWKIVMIQARPGHVVHIPGQGVATMAAGGGINMALFAGTVIRNDGVKHVGASKVAMLRLAVACEPKYDKQMSMDEKKAQTVYLDITAWRGLAEKWLYKAEVKDSLLVVGHATQRVRDGILAKGKPVVMTEIDIVDVSLETEVGRGGGGGARTGGGTGTPAPSVDDDLPFISDDISFDLP